MCTSGRLGILLKKCFSCCLKFVEWDSQWLGCGFKFPLASSGWTPMLLGVFVVVVALTLFVGVLSWNDSGHPLQGFYSAGLLPEYHVPIDLPWLLPANIWKRWCPLLVFRCVCSGCGGKDPHSWEKKTCVWSFRFECPMSCLVPALNFDFRSVRAGGIYMFCVFWGGEGLASSKILIVLV